MEGANWSLKLQQGDDQKTDALILQGMDGQALNDLSPAPHAICSIGQIMCLAVKQDFDLMVKGGPQCRLLRHPESFRATMVQVAEEAQAAFLKAHGSMQQLALQMGSVPGHLKQTVKLLLNKDGMGPQQLGRHVTLELEAVDRVGQTCLALAEETHKKFAAVLELLWETQQRLTSKRGATEKEKKELVLQKQLAADASTNLERRKAQMQLEMQRLEKEAQEAKDQMNKVMASKPSSGDLVGAAFAEAGCSMIQSLAHCVAPAMLARMGRAVPQTVPAPAPVAPAPAPQIPVMSIAKAATAAMAVANVQFAPQIDLLLGATSGLWAALKGAQSITKEEGQKMATQLKEAEGVLTSILGKAQQATNSGLAQDASSIAQLLLEPMKRAETALAQGDRETCKELSTRVDAILQKTRELAVKKASVLQGNVLPPGQPFQSNGKSAIGDSMVGAWKFQTEAAKQLLLEANRRRDEEFKRLHDLNDRLMQENQKLARLKIEDLKMDEVIEILKQAIRQIGACQEAWSRLVQLFMYIHELTQFCCKKQIKDFVQKASQLSLDLQQGDQFTRCLRDQIYQMVVRTSQTAYTAQHLAETYHSISDAHFLKPLASVSKINGMELGKELEQTRHQLMNECENAAAAVKQKVLDQRSQTRQQIQSRLQSICNVMDKEFGEAPADIKATVSHAVQEVRQGSSYAAPAVVAIDLDENELI